MRPGVLALALLAACDPQAMLASEPTADPPRTFTVTRGDLQEHLLLTGMLDAADSIELMVPRTDNGGLAIRWMAEDGAVVHAGDKVVEFENSAVLEKIYDLEVAAIEADIALSKAKAENGVAAADKKFEVTTKETEVEKAQLEADLPEGLQSRREHREAVLKLSRAKVALTAAKDDYASTLDGGKLDEQVKRIAFDKALRAYRAADEQLETLMLGAPRDGMFSVGMLPWEGRKLQVGDTVWPGMGVGKLPNLSRMVVEAQLSDVDDGRVHDGMAVRCTVDAYGDQPLAGSIRAVSPVARDSTRGSLRRFFAVVVDLDEAAVDPEILRPGLSVKVEVLSRKAEDAVLVPRAALDRSQDPARARLASGEEVEVELQVCTPQACAVTSGLAEGDEVLAREDWR